ncbi:MAG: tRNA-guanine(15) transglycosylase, partial [Thermoplasmata archaeon]|nr:tRNA-guanine(15) transglycosylase [Thermoplasmata archaeon]
SAVLDMQFGRGAADILKGREVTFIKSRNTGKIRNVLVDGTHVLSMRAHDGRFTLKLEGARLLMGVLPPPAMRVTILEDAVEFVAKGANVFAKFVLDCDPVIRPGDDVMVVDPADKLVATGRALMVQEEMRAFEAGMAVRVKESRD